MAGQLPTTPAPGSTWHARMAVDAWYVVCVLVPLAAAVTSPAWFLPVVEAERPVPGHAAGFLALGWACWLVALVSARALADRDEVHRRSPGRSVAEVWDRIATRLLALTGGAGVVVTLVLSGLALARP